MSLLMRPAFRCAAVHRHMLFAASANRPTTLLYASLSASSSTVAPERRRHFSTSTHQHQTNTTSTSSTQTPPPPPKFDEVEYEEIEDAESGTLTAEERRRMIDRMLRVDHAGELGADQIYAGQLAVLGSKSPVSALITHMWEQEKEHLAIMERLVLKHDARVTVLAPLWSLAGYVLGAGSALLGKEGAMACTVAVEETIGEHYNDQVRELMADDPMVNKELLQIISKLRDEEWEHHDTGLENDALKAPFYTAFKFAVQTSCKIAIKVAERI